ncbi:hypothetical protein ACR79M_01470 [Sphingobacterium spiritivorum]|uniref:hypothetical protein n=1 Tax=Sphingobacterium spiritivorum TaxID=258 RepID=UPI003DA309F6
MKTISSPGLFTFQKYIGIVVTVIGALIFIFDRRPEASTPLMIGLFTLYISKNRVEDERTSSLKTSSLYIAFILAYTIKLISSNLFSHGMMGIQITEVDHFIILTFGIALITYYIRLYFGK